MHQLVAVPPGVSAFSAGQKYLDALRVLSRRRTRLGAGRKHRPPSTLAPSAVATLGTRGRVRQAAGASFGQGEHGLGLKATLKGHCQPPYQSARAIVEQ